jgi:type II secretory pathway component GspD/PulD (secretin)
MALLITGAALGAVPALCAENENKETKGAPAPRPKLITVDYVNAEIRDVIRALAAQSGVNLALNPEVKGQITVHLKDKTVDEAIVMTANLAGLGAKRIKETFVIAPRNEMRATMERLGTSRRVAVAHLDPKAAADIAQNSFPDLTAKAQDKGVLLLGAEEEIRDAAKLIESNDFIPEASVRSVEKFSLKHVAPAAAIAAVAKMAPGIGVDAAGEGVVLSGTKAQIDAAKIGLALLDVPARPDKETRIYKIKYSLPAQLINLLERTVPDVSVFPGPESHAPTRPVFNPVSGQFLGMAPGSGGSGNSGSALSNMQNQQNQGVGTQSEGAKMAGNALSLVLQGSPAALDAAIKVLEISDIAPRQMVIEAKVVETNPSVMEEIGLKWSWSTFGFAEGPRGTSGDLALGNSTGNTKGLGFGQITRVPFSFQAMLSAMVTNRTAKMLANPTISVIDDQDASIFIGDTLRFQSLAVSSPTSGSQFTVVEVPVGIILLCHPRVNGDNEITLRLHPVVSTVTALVNGLPQTSAREAETVVRVKDGDTLVLGGLIRDEDIREMSKVPLLGDLPIIGHLFRHNSKQHRRTEVMVVITVRLQK